MEKRDWEVYSLNSLHLRQVVLYLRIKVRPSALILGGDLNHTVDGYSGYSLVSTNQGRRTLFFNNVMEENRNSVSFLINTGNAPVLRMSDYLMYL